MNMQCTLSLKLPQFCCLGRYCFGKDPWCFPYLLQVINPSFSWSLTWLFLLAQHPPRGEPSFRVTVLAQTCNLCQNESGLEDPQLICDKRDGGPEICNPKSGTPPGQIPMRSNQYLHLRPWRHSSLTHVQVDRSLLSHARLLTAASFHLFWPPSCPLQPSLLHPQARVSHPSFCLSSCRKVSLFHFTAFSYQAQTQAHTYPNKILLLTVNSWTIQIHCIFWASICIPYQLAENNFQYTDTRDPVKITWKSQYLQQRYMWRSWCECRKAGGPWIEQKEMTWELERTVLYLV